MQRIDKLISALPCDIDGALITSESNIKYFTGFDCDAGVLLLSKGGTVFFTDSRYTEAAQRTISCCEVDNSAEIKTKLSEYCRRFSARRIGIESTTLTVAQADRFLNMLPDVELLTGNETDSAIGSLRAVKDDSEVALIKAAQRIAESAFDHILGFIRTGISEREIQLELDYFMLRNGADDLSFRTIAVSGKNSSMPHGVPTDKKIERGDFITLDFGATVCGYHSDMTRTVAVGEITDEQRRIYEIVLSAQEAALETLKPGCPCKSADAAARDLIRNAGYGNFFGHGTGHGVGIEIHELPNLNPSSTAILQPGNIVTVEPGIYLPGKFGVRIEDMALITKNGCDNLTCAAKNIIII